MSFTESTVPLQDSAGRFGEILSVQTSRIQELRRQLGSGSGSQRCSSAELQVLQEELRLALRREKENQDLSRGLADQLDSLSRTLNLKEDLIRVSVLVSLFVPQNGVSSRTSPRRGRG